MSNKTSKLVFAMGVCCFTCAAQQTVDVARQKDQIDVSIGGKPFTTYYMNEAVAKPYLMPLRSAHGTIVTRGYPVGNEVPAGSEHDRSFEPHQRPLVFRARQHRRPGLLGRGSVREVLPAITASRPTDTWRSRKWTKPGRRDRCDQGGVQTYWPRAAVSSAKKHRRSRSAATITRASSTASSRFAPRTVP